MINRQAARYTSCTFDISCRRLENLLEELVFFINAYVSPDADVMPQQGKKKRGILLCVCLTTGKKMRLHNQLWFFPPLLVLLMCNMHMFLVVFHFWSFVTGFSVQLHSWIHWKEGNVYAPCVCIYIHIYIYITTFVEWIKTEWLVMEESFTLRGNWAWRRFQFVNSIILGCPEIGWGWEVRLLIRNWCGKRQCRLDLYN